jgi:hypothetical protein
MQRFFFKYKKKLNQPSQVTSLECHLSGIGQRRQKKWHRFGLLVFSELPGIPSAKLDKTKGRVRPNKQVFYGYSEWELA